MIEGIYVLDLERPKEIVKSIAKVSDSYESNQGIDHMMPPLIVV